MRRRWRWVVMAAATAFVLLLPLAARLLPSGDSTVSAATLLNRIRASATVEYSGYAVSQGGLSLPVSANEFDAISDLFGGTSQLRVWWRGDDDWRVDTLGLTGESDLHRDSGGTWSWDYEADSVRRNTNVDSAQVRLPRSDDLVPATLARRLLDETDVAHVSRLPGVRVAGETTAGLRLSVRDARSTVDHIDVWALPASGLPVRVEVYGSSKTPVISSSFLDLTLGTPEPATTRFVPRSGSFQDDRFGDIVSAIDTFGRSNPPNTVAGLPRRTDLDLGAVGVYGRGATLLVALPLSPRLAGDIVPQLRATPGAVENDTGISAGVGPLNLQLSPPVGFGSRWLLVGTVTPEALVNAVAGLPPVEGFGFGRR